MEGLTLTRKHKHSHKPSSSERASTTIPASPQRHAPTGPVRAELLSPAGSLEAFFAAMESGADAVYCGLQSFSARAKAKNFSLQDLGAMSAYAHSQGRKLFVTVNTLIKEAELPELIDTLAGVSEARVDAVILQDLGVWRLARNYFPELELHSSTQMTVHNVAGLNSWNRWDSAARFWRVNLVWTKSPISARIPGWNWSILFMEPCASVFPANACFLLTWAEKAATAGAVPSRVGGATVWEGSTVTIFPPMIYP